MPENVAAKMVFCNGISCHSERLNILQELPVLFSKGQCTGIHFYTPYKPKRKKQMDVDNG
jgi:hypothetical protein